MNNIEEYQNLVALLKEALKFYANGSNYTQILNERSNINIDGGSQARFALGKIGELEEINQKILDDYINISDKILDDVEDKLENGNLDVQDIMNTIKNLTGENNNI